MAPKKLYTPHQMGLAIEAVKSGQSASFAAKKYGVPRMTLRNKVKGISPAVCSMGPSTTLSSGEEALLIEWLFAMAERHCPVGKEQLLDSVQLIIKADKRENPFVNDRPGRKWYDLFLKRHPEISERICQNLTTSREAVKEEQILTWFSQVGKYIEDNHYSDVLRDPSRVFNTDESAFFLNPKPGRVLVKRGDKNIYSTSGNEKENLTVLLTANAAGQLAPPMVVFSYERVPRNIAESIPINWGIGRSENGWMCGSTFFEYIVNIFYPWLIENKVKLPIIFFLDGHASHLTKHLSDFCSDKQIEIVVLYPNSTHLLQPMDVAVFRPLKLFWRQQTRKWKTENLGQQVKKENFAPILKSALDNITPDCIKNGFRRGGLFPFGPDLIDFTKLNVHNRSITIQDSSVSTQNEAFLCKLEKEIVKIFTKSKLDTFNKCFYLPKTEMTAELPNEDLTLYTIWAKYKHLCQVIYDVGRATGDMNIETNEDPKNSEMQEVLDKHISEGSQRTIQTEVVAVQIGERSQSAIQNQNLLEVLPVQKTPSKIWSSTSLTSNADQNQITTITNVPSTSSGFGEHILKEKGVVVPSPFKKALFWPEPATQKKLRISKEKIPSVITSKAWRDYHLKKESEKKAKEDAKEQRKQILQEKRELKEAAKKSNEEKARKKAIDNQRTKRRRRLSVTSSDSDTSLSLEVTYAESGESDFEGLSDDEEKPLIAMRRKERHEAILHIASSKTKQKYSNQVENNKCQPEPVEKISKVTVENLPQIESVSTIEERRFTPVPCVLSPKKLLQNSLTVNDYVLVTWNERSYPGQIIDESQEGLLVSCMKKSNDFWRWPVQKDIQLYHWDNVVCQIGIPKFIKKGCFTIPEIDNF